MFLGYVMLQYVYRRQNSNSNVQGKYLGQATQSNGIGEVNNMRNKSQVLKVQGENTIDNF